MMASPLRRVGSSFDEHSSGAAQKQRIALENASIERADQLIETAGELQAEFAQHLVNLIEAGSAAIQRDERDLHDDLLCRRERRGSSGNNLVLQPPDVYLHR